MRRTQDLAEVCSRLDTQLCHQVGAAVVPHSGSVALAPLLGARADTDPVVGADLGRSHAARDLLVAERLRSAAAARDGTAAVGTAEVRKGTHRSLSRHGVGDGEPLVDTDLTTVLVGVVGGFADAHAHPVRDDDQRPAGLAVVVLERVHHELGARPCLPHAVGGAVAWLGRTVVEEVLGLDVRRVRHPVAGAVVDADPQLQTLGHGQVELLAPLHEVQRTVARHVLRPEDRPGAGGLPGVDETDVVDVTGRAVVDHHELLPP